MPGAAARQGGLQIARFRVRAKMATAQRFSGGLRDQLLSGKATAVLPDVLPQPVEQCAEITAGNLLA